MGADRKRGSSQPVLSRAAAREQRVANLPRSDFRKDESRNMEGWERYIHLHDRTGTRAGQTISKIPVEMIDTNHALMAFRETIVREKTQKKHWYFKNGINEKERITKERKTVEEQGRKSNNFFTNVGTIEAFKQGKEKKVNRRCQSVGRYERIRHPGMLQHPGLIQ